MNKGHFFDEIPGGVTTFVLGCLLALVIFCLAMLSPLLGLAGLAVPVVLLFLNSREILILPHVLGTVLAISLFILPCIILGFLFMWLATTIISMIILLFI